MMRFVLAMGLLLAAGCSTVDYGDLHYTRWGAQEISDLAVTKTEADGSSITVTIGDQKADDETLKEALETTGDVAGAIKALNGL